jgi:hypothetical protein
VALMTLYIFHIFCNGYHSCLPRWFV